MATSVEHDTEKATKLKCLDVEKESTVGQKEPADVDDREKWSSKTEFFLSIVGLCIGLGNIWRFPYICYKNGGGAFLIPYLLTLVVGGIPTLYLEMLLGQSFSIGGLGIWKYCKLFKGVGYAAIVMAFWLSVYYIVVLAYAFFYMIKSFAFWSPLEWASCENTWNTVCCRETVNMTLACEGATEKYMLDLCKNCTKYTSPAGEYWERYVLDKSAGIEYPDGIRWPLAATLLVSWILCYLAIFKGVKWTGKVVYFTALFPYVLMTILFFRAVTLEGASIGIKFYLYPDFSQLKNSRVWCEAASQIFFTYGLGLGTHIALASYNPKRNNCQRDALMIAVVNTLTSLFSGLVIFSIIGYLSHTFQVPVDRFADTGYGLAFVVYATAVNLFPGSHIWAILFFMMIVLVGLDSQFCTLEGLITAIVDEWPGFFKKRRHYFILIICFISYIIGISTVSRGGSYVIVLFDHYAASGYALLLLIFFQCIAFSWFFGVRRMSKFFEEQTGIRIVLWWKICWCSLCPAITLGISLFYLVTSPSIGLVGYEYPKWAIAIGIVISASSIGLIPIYAIYHGFVVFKDKKNSNLTIKEKIQAVLWPDLDEKVVGNPGVAL